MWIDRINYKKFVVISLFLSGILICVAWKILKENESRILVYDFDEKIVSEGFDYCLDEVSYTDEMVKIVGWLVKPGTSISTAQMHVILKNTKTEIYYMIPTEIKQRNDISEVINDGNNYDMCGFYAYIHSDNFQIQEDDFEIYILYQSNNEKKLVPLNTTIRGWNSNDEN